VDGVSVVVAVPVVSEVSGVSGVSDVVINVGYVNGFAVTVSACIAASKPFKCLKLSGIQVFFGGKAISCPAETPPMPLVHAIK
jgi:hypothetical protein